jgi:RNA polymerase sigma-70 factor (ECF subfamily)
MVRLAWRYSGQLASAEDAVQEALVRIWLRAGQWDSSRGSAKSWMDRIVVNLCIDQGRRMVQTVDMDVLEDRIDSAPNPHDQLFGRQLDRAIREAIDALPERQRAALSLCFAKETDCAQGALILGVSVPTMESLLLRGRRSLRKRLAELGFLPKL